jgi:hypothetical protein
VSESDNTSVLGKKASFAALMSAYPHPHGAVDKAAYWPTALTAWNKLTADQKWAAVRTAPKAPGKLWVSHWLNIGWEAGTFEVEERHVTAERVWVRDGTPQWRAWARSYDANGRKLPTTQHRVNGEKRRVSVGW